jgi:energy-coupling factor transport system substrate-specific component
LRHRRDNDKINNGFLYAEIHVVEGKMRRLKSWKSWIILLLCLCINVAGRSLASALNLPLWLDAIGTIVAAVELGPVAGAICGILLNLVTSSGDPLAFPYMAVSAGVGISVGLLYPREKVTNLKIVTAAILTGLVAALISTPINLIIYQGNTGNEWGDGFMNMIARDVHVPLITSFLGECFVDLPDKALSFFLALGIIKLGRRIDKTIIKKVSAAALILALLSPLFLGLRSEAADFGAEYAGVTYDSDTGLESVEVNAITQTGDGYVWAGSYAGLYRYDGFKFKLINLDDRIKNVMVLKVDSKGYMWIGTNDNGLACYDYRTGEVEFFTTEEGLSSNVIRDVAEDCNGDMYVATATQLCRLNSERQVEAFEGNSYFGVKKLAASGKTVAAIRLDGSIVVFSGKRLVYVLGGNYTSVSAESEGNYIVGASNNITGRLYFTQGSTDVMSKHYSGDLACYNDILYSREFKGAFVCCENGLGFLSDRGSMTVLTTDDFGSSVVDVMVDYQGNVWFASNKQGVKKFSWNPFEDIFARAGINGSVVNSVMVKDGLMYAGTSTGLVTIDLKTYYSVPIPHPNYLKNVRIRNIMCDSKGNVWFSLYGGSGLIEMQPDNSLVIFNKETASTEGENFILAKELSDGRIVAVSNTGLNFIKNDKIQKTLGEHDGITAQILCVTETEDGMLYAGSDGGGIYVIKNDEIVNILDEEYGLETSVVMKIVPCKGGFIYVTSNALYYDKGGEVKRLYHFPYSNNYDVYIDENGKAWVLSSGGIYVLQEKDLLKDGSYNYLLLNRSRGLYTSITSEADYCLSGGKLYVPCTDGVRRISTDNYDSFNNEYDIRISELTAGDDVIEPKDGVYNIPAISGRIQFDVAVLNYSLSDPILHIYLKGAEDEGVICTQKKMQNLTFTNLPSGDYELHVEVMDTSGNNLLRDEVFPVHKESQIFERAYFKSYMLLMGMLLVMYIGWLISDILQRFSSIKVLEQEATKDPLTGLLNKRGARAALEPKCSKGKGMLTILDLDNFKPVNDLYGHDMGDRILIELSNILKEHAGSEDVLCRTGGDEFVAFFEGMDHAGLRERASLLNVEIMDNARKHLGEAMPIPIGLSIGAVEVKGPEENSTYDEYLKKADKALYAVKNAGKHDFLLYDEERMEKESLDNQGVIPGFKRIRTVLGERGEHGSAYRADGDRMQAVFHIVSRMKENGITDAVLLKFAILGIGDNKTTTETDEEFADLLKQNLTATDVISVGGRGRVMAMLVGKTEEDGELIGNEIIKIWEANPENSKYSVTFEKEML